MDMPSTIEDLRLLSREYMKNLGVTDDLQDEQVYLQYIEEHLKAQERVTASAMASGVEGSEQRSRMGKGGSIAGAALSPIRNLGEFY